MKNEKFWWIGNLREVQVAARFPGGMRAALRMVLGLLPIPAGLRWGFPYS